MKNGYRQVLNVYGQYKRSCADLIGSYSDEDSYIKDLKRLENKANKLGYTLIFEAWESEIC